LIKDIKQAMTTAGAAEPQLNNLPNPIVRYWLATRPAFLSVTLFGGLLGLASAASSGISIDLITAALTLLAALLTHAGANVVNDYHDARSGCDEANHTRIFPFTGGSRFIQNGVLTEAAVRRFGYALLGSVIPIGLYLTARSGSGLLGIGITGLLLAWAYSAPPLKLQSRGLGEFAITGAWLLIVVGSDYVQRQHFAFAPVAAGLGFALLLANLLYINQFPDVSADAHADKRTLVVRRGARRARYGYALMALLAYAWVIAMVAIHALPTAALIALLPALASAQATRQLWRYAETPAQLAPAIKLTILASSLHGLLMAAVLASHPS